MGLRSELEVRPCWSLWAHQPGRNLRLRASAPIRLPRAWSQSPLRPAALWACAQRLPLMEKSLVFC